MLAGLTCDTDVGHVHWQRQAKQLMLVTILLYLTSSIKTHIDTSLPHTQPSFSELATICLVPYLMAMQQAKGAPLKAMAKSLH